MNNTNIIDHVIQRLVPKSIQGRLLIASLMSLPIFCGFLGLSLDRAFTNSLRTGEQAQLTLQAYALIAAAELEGGQLWLPEQLTETRLNQPSSGLFAAIYAKGKQHSVWRSNSALNDQLLTHWTSRGEQYGEALFGTINQANNTFFFLQYNVFWEDSSGTQHPFQFVIFESTQYIEEQIAAYRKNLWSWLSAIALAITLLQLLIMRWGLRPIREVSNDLKKIQSGRPSILEGSYPTELSELTDSINTLISNEAEQRNRYKNTLSDLAHSLKTPLSIMQGSLQSTEKIDQQELEQQIYRIDQIISHQLKRSVNAPSNPFSEAIPIEESCESVVSALKKVYREKPVEVKISIPPKLKFRGDKGDLLEIVGNLLDNAFKYGRGNVQVSGKPLSSNKIMITISDNGPGVDSEQYTQLLKRGERADTSQPGQGIGLSVVADIVSSYRGSIALARSPLGGLAVIVQI
ncbi:ATP-binding protein [Alkalimarinus alittae]|uniref:histidine kinase n=1 Tax=Alkalimarinus alittae TaxID=2961619 RepID=A0ABY6N0B3_9ALTE|nr:ATP-binding protein [Alkalimarinus alittae]UZE95462.1 ATP-binding protein [Alkalimarinus alittae]